jgi:lysophospholipase L1-like esterase
MRRLLTVMTAALLAVVTLAAPASAADRGGTPQYLALGDSLAFGYQPSRDFTEGYVDQLYATLHAKDPRLALTNLGCPGETSRTLRLGGKCPYPNGASQLDTAVAFLRAHRHSVRLVTIDIGGNDVDGCVTASGIDQTCFAQGLWTIAVNLFVTVHRLREAAPGVTVVGMTYYDTALAAWLTGAAGQALATASLPLIREFNGLLTILYRSGGFRVADVAGAFATDDMTDLVGGVPLDVARICQWTWMCAPAPLGPDIHANTAGYGVIAKAFAAVL